VGGPSLGGAEGGRGFVRRALQTDR
jgi:hypothetical protein